MNLRITSPVRAALVALLVLFAPAALAGEDAPYPIWWSPVLELESLGDIQWKLKERFPPTRWYEVVTSDLRIIYTDTFLDESHPEWGYDWNSEIINIERRKIDNCESLIKWRERGFNIELGIPKRNYAIELDAFYSGYCYALSALITATAAKQSFLSSFVFDENALRYLPPMIGMSWGEKSLNQFLQANREGVSWQDFEYGWFEDQRPNYKVIVKDKYTISVVDTRPAHDGYPDFIASAVLISIYGRGDFNGDGIDDLLIRSEETEATLDDDPEKFTSSLYVVTRREGDTVLRVVDYLGPPPNGRTSPHSSSITIID